MGRGSKVRRPGRKGFEPGGFGLGFGALCSAFEAEGPGPSQYGTQYRRACKAAQISWTPQRKQMMPVYPFLEPSA